MSKTDTVFAGSIPETYDTLIVPLIFQPYADDLARRVAALHPRDVLETAAGTGVVTRALAAALDHDARLTVTDLNQPMLDQALRRLAADPRLTWRQADALALPFADAEFDVVVCQFGVMFFPDRVKGYAEARRVLRPQGRFMFNVWNTLESNELPAFVTATLVAMYPAAPPRFLERTPHGHHDTATIRAELAAAGFSQVSLQTVEADSVAPSAQHAARAFCTGTPLRGEIEAASGGRLDEAVERVTAAITARFGAGPITSRISAHVIEAAR